MRALIPAIVAATAPVLWFCTENWPWNCIENRRGWRAGLWLRPSPIRMDHDSGFFDQDDNRVEPVGNNPFNTTALLMSPVRTDSAPGAITDFVRKVFLHQWTPQPGHIVRSQPAVSTDRQITWANSLSKV